MAVRVAAHATALSSQRGRQNRDRGEGLLCVLCPRFLFIRFFPSSALCELFDKADVTKDGTISFAEYQAMCDEYGVKLQPEDRVAIKAIADEDGEVNIVMSV